MNLKQSINSRLQDFLFLCKTHNVKSIYAFGSSVTNQFDEENSDFDFLIEIENEDPIQRGESLMELWDHFEALFHRKIDLLTNSSIRNPILKRNIDRTKVLIYDGENQKIFV